MLEDLKEKDFKVLRGPFESQRQSPKMFGGILLLSIFLSILMFFLVYYVVADSSDFANKNIIFNVHLALTLLICLLSGIYAIPAIYKRSETMQYIVSILVIQNIGLMMFMVPLFIASSRYLLSGYQGPVATIAITNLVIGLIIFIWTWVRFMKLLKKGAYRPGSKRETLRGRFETTSYVPAVIVASTGLVLMLRSIVETFRMEDIETIFMTILATLIFYTLVFVLPEQIVIIYCKNVLRASRSIRKVIYIQLEAGIDSTDKRVVIIC